LAISVFGLRGVDVFAGPSTGDAVLALLGMFVVFHVAAFNIGLCMPRPNRYRLPAVVLVALSPIGVLYVDSFYDTIVRAPRRPYERFCDYLVSPIPSSVSDLEFVPVEEKHSTHLMLRFSISSNDLDSIIKQLGFVLTSPADFRCPVDEFKNPKYLPLPGPAAFYTYEDHERGYPEPGWGAGHTLKVSSDRTQAIYRTETAQFYRYRSWEKD